MPRKSIHIRHNQCFSSFPCFSAYAPSFLYPRTSHRTLKRSKYQLLTFYQIKSYPEETESLLQRCCNVGKIGNKVILICNQTLNLRKQRTILFFLAAITDTQVFCHSSSDKVLFAPQIQEEHSNQHQNKIHRLAF